MTTINTEPVPKRMSNAENDITMLLQDAASGCNSSRDELLNLVYRQLKVIAQSKMKDIPPNQSLQPTALVNEMYIRLFGKSTPQSWENRRHFFWAVSRAMHDILVEKARSRMALKRGGGKGHIDYQEYLCPIDSQALEMIALSDALEVLERRSARASEVARLVLFAGLSHAEIARVLNVSVATVRREWAFAKAIMASE